MYCNDDVGGEYEIENNALKSIIFCSASKVIKVQFQGRIGACFQNPAISVFSKIIKNVSILKREFTLPKIFFLLTYI